MPAAFRRHISSGGNQSPVPIRRNMSGIAKTVVIDISSSHSPNKSDDEWGDD